MSLRKPRPIASRIEGKKRDARFVVIGTEDTYIQREYFGKFQSSRVVVRVVHTDGESGKSAPGHVLQRIKEEIDGTQWEDGDEFWLSIDTDDWFENHKAGLLKALVKQATDAGVTVVLSNPCFEQWLLLHVQDNPCHSDTCAPVCEELGKKVGAYNKKSLPPGLVTLANVHAAIARARRVDKSPDDLGLKEPGSRLYRLAERLLSMGATPPSA